VSINYSSNEKEEFDSQTLSFIDSTRDPKTLQEYSLVGTIIIGFKDTGVGIDQVCYSLLHPSLSSPPLAPFFHFFSSGKSIKTLP
jgi:hypothetical protein